LSSGNVHVTAPFVCPLVRSCLRILDQVRGQGAGRRKGGAYTTVCEHFALTCNAAIGPETEL